MKQLHAGRAFILCVPTLRRVSVKLDDVCHPGRILPVQDEEAFQPQVP